MNRLLNVIPLEEDKVLLAWEKNENASHYNIVGIDHVFASHVIKTCKSLKAVMSFADLKPYNKIYVQCLTKDGNKDRLLATTEEWVVREFEYKNIDIHCIPSYKGYTLSFYSDSIYDQYYLYERTEKEDRLICVGEDFQVTSNQIKEGKQYYVEGYEKVGYIYELRAKSSPYTCVAESISKPEKVDLSIVVPVFNGELFLSRTMDSLLLSTLKNIEIILVDDGSTDASKEIMEWYKNRYPDIVRCYYQENQGVCVTRNYGINCAIGEYTALLDDDDLVHPYMYEILYNAAKQDSLDIAIAKTLIREDVQKYNYCLDVQKDENKDVLIYTFDEMFTEYRYYTQNNIFFVAVWNKIIKTDLMKKHLFPIPINYEDTAFTMTIYSYIDRFAFCKKAYYVWDKRFRKTIGTATSRYEKYCGVNLNIYFVRALFHVCNEGNPNRLDYLAYYSIIELFNYLTESKLDLYHNSFSSSYIEAIKDVGKRTDLYGNLYIQNNRPLGTFVSTILNM